MGSNHCMWNDIIHGDLLLFAFFTCMLPPIIAWWINHIKPFTATSFSELDSSFQSQPSEAFSSFAVFSLNHPKLMEEPPAKKTRGQKQRLAAMQAPAEPTRPSLLGWRNNGLGVTWVHNAFRRLPLCQLKTWWPVVFNTSHNFYRLLHLLGLVAKTVTIVTKTWWSSYPAKQWSVHLCKWTLLWKMDYICNPSCCPMRSSIACGKGTMRFFSESNSSRRARTEILLG